MLHYKYFQIYKEKETHEKSDKYIKHKQINYKIIIFIYLAKAGITPITFLFNSISRESFFCKNFHKISLILNPLCMVDFSSRSRDRESLSPIIWKNNSKPVIVVDDDIFLMEEFKNNNHNHNAHITIILWFHFSIVKYNHNHKICKNDFVKTQYL